VGPEEGKGVGVKKEVRGLEERMWRIGRRG
jgi:hypothetical protein